MRRALPALRALRSVGLGVGALALAGCWPMPGANPDRTSHNPFEATLTRDTVGDLTEQWRWTSPLGVVSDPVTSNAGVHVVTACVVSTLAPATGVELWSGAIADAPSCQPTGGAHVGEPYVVEAAGGQEVLASWGQSVVRAPGFLIASWSTRSFDVATGVPSQSLAEFVVATRDGAQVSSTRGPVAPATAADLVTVDGRTFRLHANAASVQDPVSSLTLGEDLVYHSGYGVLATAPGPATFGNGVRGYSRLDDRPGCGPVVLPSPLSPVPVECPVWATPTDGVPTRPVLDAVTGTLYSRTDAGTLYALDAATGAVEWTASGLGAGGAPAVAGDSVWVPTGDGRVLPFSIWGCGAATCGPWLSWHVDTGTGAPVTAVAVAGDVVYATSAGAVYAVSSCTSGACPVLWSGPGDGAPVISGGRLYVRDGADLVAYGLP